MSMNVKNEELTNGTVLFEKCSCCAFALHTWFSSLKNKFLVNFVFVRQLTSHVTCMDDLMFVENQIFLCL